MMTLSEMLLELGSIGLSEAAIVKELKSSGCAVSQATINRLKKGIHKTTSYEIGVAIKNLHVNKIGLALSED